MTRYFATRNDLLPEFKKMEIMLDIQYVSCEDQPDINIPVYNHFEDLPLIDQANKWGIYPMSNPYIIIPRGATFRITNIYNIVRGITVYYVKIGDNLDHLTLTHGGWYAYNNEQVYIGGLVSLFRGYTEKAKELYRPFSRNLCRKFAVIKDWENGSWKVGPEALEYLRSGVRFITDNDPQESLRSHDLVLPDKCK